MSYSRWSNSKWYTFWCVPNGKEDRDNAVFEVCDICTFTAKQLREDRVNCLNEILDIDHDTSESELLELESYMLQFLADVETKHGK
jgi:hypothetical protein